MYLFQTQRLLKRKGRVMEQEEQKESEMVEKWGNVVRKEKVQKKIGAGR
jgi:hypothetical protein